LSERYGRLAPNTTIFTPRFDKLGYSSSQVMVPPSATEAIKGTFAPTEWHLFLGIGCTASEVFCVAARKPAAAHLEYTFGMFVLREQRSSKPSTRNGSFARWQRSSQRSRNSRCTCKKSARVCIEWTASDLIVTFCVHKPRSACDLKSHPSCTMSHPQCMGVSLENGEMWTKKPKAESSPGQSRFDPIRRGISSGGVVDEVIHKPAARDPSHHFR